ncbi:MAG: hypothetical protein LC624_10565 [Halobacteriales archaeon]|nr:hypothetical protein [Halobacteriales archaeon]
MNAQLLLLTAAVAMVVAGTAAADPIIISLNCTATVTANAFAVLMAIVANPPEFLLAPGAMVDAVNNILSTSSGCISVPLP